MKTALLLRCNSRLILLLTCCLSLFSFPAYSQKEANIWYFGVNAGLNFNYNPPRVLTDGQAVGGLGYSSVCDASGSLLFYAGGQGSLSPLDLYDRRHQGMPNSGGSGARYWNTLIIPWPGQSQKYYYIHDYFNFSGSTGYKAYSVVDMALNGGFGDFTSTKHQFLCSFGAFDILTVQHRNYRDYWLITQTQLTSSFQTYLVSSTGLNTTPVVSTPAGFPPSIVGADPAFKVSPDGKTLALVQAGLQSTNGRIELLNFDAATGIVTYKGSLPDTAAQGIEFSPDGTKLYANRLVSSGKSLSAFELVQYDLEAGNPAAIYNSAITVFQSGPLQPSRSSLQVGPDGKIYSTAGFIPGTGTVPGHFGSTTRYLSVINRPNLKGTACRFIPNMIDLDVNNSGIVNAGIILPTFIQSYFYRPKIDLQQTCFGDTVLFQLSNNAYVDSVRWNFGDPASGALNKSTAFNPKHFYATPGPKQVQAIVHFNFTSDTLNQTIYIPVSITKPNLGPDRSICPGDTLLLRAFQPGATYEWQDSLTTDSIYVVTKPGTYWVQVSNGCGVRTDSVTITFDQPLSLSLGADTLLCPGQQLQLQVNAPDATVLWSDSTSGNSITVTKPGTYWAQLSNACGSWRDSINVSYRPAPAAQWLPNDLILCKQTQYIINGTHPDALSYRWQDGSTSSTFTATVSGTYWLEVTTACTTIRDSINLTLIPTPPINLGADTLLCQGEQLQLQVSTRGGNIRWQDGSTDTVFTVTKPGIYWAEISNSCGSWRDSVTVTYRSPSITNWLPKDTTLCLQNRFVINGQHPDAVSYKWQDGSSNIVFEARTSGIYWVDVTTACTTLRDSVQITLLPLPTRLLPTDTLLCSGESIVLKAPTGKSYKWSTGQTSQTITVSQPGTYKVEVGMSENCFYSGSVNVKEERCYRTAFIPNIITPNNDNQNDRFEPKGLEAGTWQLEIYNRWGSRIYQNSNYTNQWPEQDIPAATYYYLLRNKESGKTYKGWIEVVK